MTNSIFKLMTSDLMTSDTTTFVVDPTNAFKKFEGKIRRETGFEKKLKKLLELHKYAEISAEIIEDFDPLDGVNLCVVCYKK